MEKLKAIFNSDQITRDGVQFTISALEDGIWLAGVYGVPSNLSHDLHRPVGWAYPKGLYFEADKVLTVGYFLLAEDEKDATIISDAKQRFLNNMINKDIALHSEKFKSALGSLYSENGQWFSNGMVMFGYENIVYNAFPELAAHIAADKDGLVSLEFLFQHFDYLQQGAFRKKGSDIGIMAHPYFRKSQSIFNNFHWTFLEELISLHMYKGVTIKLKVDVDFLGYAPSFIPAHEFEFWWGPKYDDDITTIQPGLTQYGSNEFEKLYYNILRTEFVWKKEGPQYTLELEEVKNQPAPTLEDRYACRYVHSIYDERKSGFDHFDGAIRAYTTELMMDRVDKKMTEMGRRSEYTKLFRVDGNLPLANWKSLVTNYLQGNPQIYEYFGLAKPDVQMLSESKVLSPLEKYVSYSINKGEGIRLYVTYHEKEQDQPEERFIDSYDLITLEEGQVKAIEYFVVELKKALQRTGIELKLPKDCLYLSPEDYYVNIPNIFHADKNTQQLLNGTLKGLRLLIDRLCSTTDQEVLSFTFSWNMEDKKTVVSVMGHVSDLNAWFKSFEDIPVQRDGFKQWLTAQAIYIKANSSISFCPVLSTMTQDDGILYLQRRLVRKDADMQFDGNEMSKCTLSFYEEDLNVKELLDNGTLAVAPTMIIKKMICEKTGSDYIDSPYSIIFDEDTNQRPVDFMIAAYHWTDKPRPLIIGD